MSDDFTIKAEALINEIPSWLKDMGQRGAVAMQGYIGAEMGAAGTSESWKQGKSNSAFNPAEETWSNEKNLRVKGGRLLASFGKDSPDTLTKIEHDKMKLNITVGSKLIYANVHEEGMQIKSKGRMHKYFWAMYYKTNNPFFERMALSVMARGGVTIPARPYFKPAVREFERKFVSQWILSFLDRIVKALT